MRVAGVNAFPTLYVKMVKICGFVGHVNTLKQIYSIFSVLLSSSMKTKCDKPNVSHVDFKLAWQLCIDSEMFHL